MFFWYLGLSWVAVWSVFRSPALDYRLVMVGAVLPVAELPFGTGPLHTLLAPVVALTVVMLATSGRRLVRRRWLGLPIGMFVHLVLDGSVARPELFWWPVGGSGAFGESLPETSAGIWLLAGELIGLGALLWAIGRFGLDDAERRGEFLRTGRLDRDLTGAEPDSGC
ncbi:MAG: hypothetical protein R2704_11015 [Microthrixaceae bacterium]|nr:hypothetical protein [Microthrixaceae bacterium]